jgi:prepilin-type N-terminal cleavage/methylation domain-containing protein
MKRSSSDGGFTLIELMITVAITGIVVVAVAGSLSTVFLSSSAAAVRESRSHDAQNAAAYFAQDVQSVGIRNWSSNSRPLVQSIETGASAPYNGGLYPCGTPTTPNALVRFAWDDFQVSNPATPDVVVASYVAEPTGPSGLLQLHRLMCRNGSLVTDRTIIHGIAAGATVTCDPSPCSGSAPVPYSVSLTVTVHDSQTADPDLNVTLQGHRRQTCAESENASCSSL